MPNSIRDAAEAADLALHIAAGTLALVTFWIAAMASKGGVWHVRSGRLHVMAMRVIIVTALPLALAAFASGHTANGLFLVELIALVTTTTTLGPRAVRMKNDFEAFRRGPFPWLAWGLPIVSVAAFATGIGVGAVLLLGIALVGIALGVHLQRTLRVARPAPLWWLRQHYTSMIGDGVAAHVAFLSIGLSRWIGGSPYLSLLPWVLPAVAALVARRVLDKRYRRAGARPSR